VRGLEPSAIPSLGTKLNDESLRIALGLQLRRCSYCTRICGSEVDVHDYHGSCCKHSGGHIPRHSSVNVMLYCQEMYLLF